MAHTGEMADPDRQHVAAAKNALRHRLRRARAGAAGDPEVAHRLDRAATAGAAVRRLLDARTGTVLAYAATPGEPDLAPLRARLRENGIRVLLPVVAGPGELVWAADTGRLRLGRELPGGLRLPEPDPAGAVRTADLRLGPDDVALVPALAAGRDGARLGQGGGYYDRALAHLPPHPDGPLVVAVVHDDELLAAGEVPTAPHDRQVDAVLTPSRWVALR